MCSVRWGGVTSTIPEQVRARLTAAEATGEILAVQCKRGAYFAAAEWFEPWTGCVVSGLRDPVTRVVSGLRDPVTRVVSGLRDPATRVVLCVCLPEQALQPVTRPLSGRPASRAQALVASLGMQTNSH